MCHGPSPQFLEEQGVADPKHRARLLRYRDRLQRAQQPAASQTASQTAGHLSLETAAETSSPSLDRAPAKPLLGEGEGGAGKASSDIVTTTRAMECRRDAGKEQEKEKLLVGAYWDSG